MFGADGYAGSGGQPPDDPLCAALEAAVDGLAADDPAGLALADQRARLRVMGRAVDRLEAQRARTLAAAEASGALAADGAATTAAWLRRHANLTDGAAAARVHVGRLQRDLPAVAAAFAAGDIGVAHVVQIDRLCDDVGYGRVAAVEDDLVTAATRLRTVKEFVQYCRGWRHALRPDLADAADDRAWANRGLTLSATSDGVVVVSGSLAARGGATVATAVNAYSHPDPPGTPRELRRSAAQVRADAMEQIATVALAAGDAPTVAGARPRVVLRVDAAQVLNHPDHPDRRRLPGQRVSLVPPTLDWAGAVGPRLAHEILGDSALTRLVTAGASQPLDVGTATRVWPAAIRAAITDRDRGCRFDPCDRPAEWCDIDHIDPWTPEHPDGDRGRTALDNGILLCRPHHRAKRRDRWWPALHTDGTVTWRHADGRHRTDRPQHLTTGHITLPDHPDPPDLPDRALPRHTNAATDTGAPPHHDNPTGTTDRAPPPPARPPTPTTQPAGAA